MLYHVRMDVHPPQDVDPARFERLKAEEKAQRRRSCNASGKWRHLWRIAGQYSQHQRVRRGQAMTSCTPSSPPCRCSPSWTSR